MRTKTIASYLALLPVSVGVCLAQARELSFEERVAAERAIQRVYYSYQIGAEDPFDVAVPRAVTEASVRDLLKRSAALERLWGTPITREALDAEMSRIAASTKLPERLEQVYEALGRDPFVVRESLARSALVDRLTRSFFSQDARIHADARRRAEELRSRLSRTPGESFPDLDGLIVEVTRRADDEAPDRGASQDGPSGRREIRRSVSEDQFAIWRAALPPRGEVGPVRDHVDAYVVLMTLPSPAASLRFESYAIPKTTWDEWWPQVRDDLDEGAVRSVASDAELPAPGDPGDQSLADVQNAIASVPDDTWDNGILDDLPDARFDHTAVWTGSQMIVWGGFNGGVLGTGDRYNPLTDVWTSTASLGAPGRRRAHTAVWTGSGMIVWGGEDGSGPLDTGARYDPATDSWTPASTQGAPSARGSHSAVWTGSRMVIWGGEGAMALDTGGAYDPGSDSWTPTSLSNAPAPRSLHTAVWTGSRMVIWGGADTLGGPLATGGRYDPLSDTWSATSGSGAPAARLSHTAIWTQNVMVVWGGSGGGATVLGAGGRYDPVADTWSATSGSGAPEPRIHHTAVWTGSRMVIWGGMDEFGDPLGSGGRYDPAANSWSSVSTTNAPEERSGHSAVWTSSLMIVWGGSGLLGGPIDTGSRYNPANNTWTPTAMGSGPVARAFHTAVWTGSQMIVWGGSGTTLLATGGRYDPMTDAWSATSTTSAPAARHSHAAVWSGTRMIVWGGEGASGLLNTGGLYNPASNSWTATQPTGAPEARLLHTAVWTNSLMIVWGGDGATGRLATGGRYNPASNSWSGIQAFNVPEARRFHTAVWTGTEMIVWGGQGTTGRLTTGGRYNPVADSWIDTTTAVVPRRRTDHTAVWTGTRMIIWGGFSPDPENTGGMYDPVENKWTATSTAGSPEGRGFHVAAWSGNRMVIWGGSSNSTQYSTGGRYNPIANAWEPTSMDDTPIGRDFAQAVWTGGTMIVWGGLAMDPLSSGGQYGAVSPDTDGDGTDDGDDCAPLDLTTSSPPTEVEVTDVTGVSPTTITYALQQTGSSAHYQVLSGLQTRMRGAMSFQEGFCLVDSTSGGSYDDTRPGPPLGDGWYYLIRAVNTCGTGTLGSALADEPGAGDVCENGILDEDIDGIRSDIDCNDLDPLARFPLEEEVQNLLISQDGTITVWGSVQPVDPSPVTYELARGIVGELPVGGGISEVCVVQGIDFTVGFDPAVPPLDEAFWYLPRARNGCGPATYGFQTDGAERVTSACP